MKNKPIYLLSPKLKWKAFNELQKILVRDSGLSCVELPKALWHMLQEKKIYCWFDPLIKNDMKVGLELPKNRDIKIISNP